MAGIKLVTDAAPDKSLEIAWRVAQDQGFALTPVQDGAFQASKGHALWTVLAGAVALYCNFKITAQRYGDNTTDVVLERAVSWTSGMIGLRRTKAEADTLMQKVAQALEKDGSKVLERKEI